MQYRWLLGIALGTLAPAVCLAQAVPQQAEAREHDALIPDSTRAVQELAQGWRFHKGAAEAQKADFDDSTWDQVSLPHSWNRIGTYEKGAGVEVPGRLVDKYQGIGWYRLTLSAPSLRKGQRAWVEFDAASRTAEVWLNGVRLGAHQGGFSRFRFDATDALRAGGPNNLAVKVDNSQPEIGGPTADTLPLAGDFFVQGGLYRPARLVVVEAAHIALDDFGGPGVYARTEKIDPQSAKVSVLSKLSNQSRGMVRGNVVVSLINRNGTIASQSKAPVKLGGGARAEVNQSLAVSQPHLWQGVKDPYLYVLKVELQDGRGRILDSTSQDFGIRQFRIDPEKGFFLNGKHVALHGVGLHQDDMASGWAMSPDQIAEHVRTIRDMGANTIRLTHYQHGQTVHDLADRYGLILWDEIGLVTAWTLDAAQGAAPQGIQDQAEQQLCELIRQNYNHPSVAVWGISNEVDFGPSRPDFLGRGIKIKPSDPTPFLEKLAALAAQEDATRPATLATCCEDRGMPDVPTVASVTPVSAANRYFGWYYSEPKLVGEHFDALHARRPQQPQAISEYGAGGALSIHTDNPLGGPIDMGGRNQPEEFQSWLHEQTWPVLAQRPFIWASWLWNSFDFATVTRKEGDAQDINTKGLVSYDGKIRKDAFYYYRAMWSNEPSVHVNGRRYVERAYPVLDVQVYSNAPATELRLNGQVVGTLKDCSNRTCVWPAVRLAAGNNEIEAVGIFPGGQRVSDHLTWHLAPSLTRTFRIDAGALVAAKAGGETFGSDNFFEGGSSGTMDKTPRGRPIIPAPIKATERRDLLATFREGDFVYRLPLEPGYYRVTLEFVEPEVEKGGRRFDVLANGASKLANFDIADAAGGNLVPVERTFLVTVGKSDLILAFKPIKGKAIVSAVTVQPAETRK